MEPHGTKMLNFILRCGYITHHLEKSAALQEATISATLLVIFPFAVCMSSWGLSLLLPQAPHNLLVRVPSTMTVTS